MEARPAFSKDTSFFGHPKALIICFLTEMWERFSYYGMRALLIFYLTQHFLFSDQMAAGIFGSYISLVYITPVIGGIISDRYLGATKSVIVGGILLVAGHLGMAIEGSPATSTSFNGSITVVRDEVSLQIFYLSLAFIIMGVGFLKGNISTLVGSLYSQNDIRRDGAFTLFYMGINAGSFLGALVCGFLLQYKGFSYGFGAAGIGMLFGLAVFLYGRNLFGQAAAPKDPQALRKNILPHINLEIIIYILIGCGILICYQLMQMPSLVGGLLTASLLIATATVVTYSLTKCDARDRDRMLVCLFLMSYQIIFWALFEQTASSLSLMTDRNFDRVILGFEIPAAAFQSVNAFFIILLAPLFNVAWVVLAKKGWEPSTPAKFALALIQLGIGFLLLVYGASLAIDPTKIAITWLILMYLLHTTGELCISPVGLSMTSRLSTPKVVGMMMGCWFLASAAGNYVSGIIAGLTGSGNIEGALVDPELALQSYIEVYLAAGLYSLAIGIFALMITPIIKKFMHESN
jgi:POT family proton-dependent oligopeptide transporter